LLYKTQSKQNNSKNYLTNFFLFVFGLIFLSTLFLTQSLNAKDFVLGDKYLLLDKTIDKLNTIGNELYAKTNYNVYLSISNKALDNTIKKHIQKQKQKIPNFDNENSILISIALDISKIEMIASLNISKFVNRNDILDDYMIPFLAGYDKNSQSSKYSAASLNGYSEVAENIAVYKGVILDSAINNGSKNFFDGFRTFMYIIFCIIIVVFAYTRLKPLFIGKKN
jgi:hypothetical protein